MHDGFWSMTPIRLRGAYIWFHRHATAHCLEVAGLSLEQSVFLALLSDHEGQTQSELAHKAHTDANTTTNILKRLEKRGLVMRKVDSRDRRAMRVYLTAEGRRTRSVMDAADRAMNPRLQKLMDSDKYAAAMEWLEELQRVHQGEYEKLRVKATRARQDVSV